MPAALQTNFRQLLQSHSETLRCVRGFWRVLLSSKASFSALSKVGCNLLQESCQRRSKPCNGTEVL